MNEKNISAILFDKDGTLIQAENIWDPYYLKVLKALSAISHKTLEEITVSCGFDIKHNTSSKQSILWSGSPSEIIMHWSTTSGISKNIVQNIAEMNYEQIDYNYPIIHNLSIIISEISKAGYSLGIATMDHSSIARKTTQALGIDHHMKNIYGTDGEYRKKPFPDMIHAFAKDLKIKSTQIMMVGDSIVDIQMAKNANAIGVGVLTGAATKEEFEKAGAFMVIEDISYISNILSKMNEE